MTTPDIKKMAEKAYDTKNMPKVEPMYSAFRNAYISAYIEGATEILEYINKHYETTRN